MTNLTKQIRPVATHSIAQCSLVILILNRPYKVQFLLDFHLKYVWLLNTSQGHLRDSAGGHTNVPSNRYIIMKSKVLIERLDKTRSDVRFHLKLYENESGLHSNRQL